MVITAFDKDRKSGAQVGVGWTQEDGSISLVLNPGTALIAMPHLSYKVKKKDAERSPTTEPFRPVRTTFQPPVRTSPKKPVTVDYFEDDDIPF